jgi:hypothetical protein
MTFDGQDNLLREAVKKYNGKKWKKIGIGHSSSFSCFDLFIPHMTSFLLKFFVSLLDRCSEA